MGQFVLLMPCASLLWAIVYLADKPAIAATMSTRVGINEHSNNGKRLVIMPTQKWVKARSEKKGKSAESNDWYG